MWTAFPSPDYYGHSVAIGLAARRRSRVRTNRTSERDVGSWFDTLNDLADRRSTGEDFRRRKTYRPIPSTPPLHAVAVDVRFHHWCLRFKQFSLNLIARVLRNDKLGMSTGLALFNHALVPYGLSPSGQIDDPGVFLPTPPTCGRDSIRRLARRTLSAHTALRLRMAHSHCKVMSRSNRSNFR